MQCERACPVDCIKIDTIKPAKGVDFDCGETSNDTRKKMIVPRFTIDMSECMYCNLCVYPCPEECIYMVGGPNEPKHDIDYEYSKYVKHDLVFEFSNVTDQQIVDIGAQSYLDERNNKIDGYTPELEQKLNALKPAAAPTAAPTAAPASAPVQASDTLDIKCLDIIEDKALKTPAKKVFFKSKRAGEDDIVKIDKVIAEISKLDGYTPELEQKLKGLL